MYLLEYGKLIFDHKYVEIIIEKITIKNIKKFVFNLYKLLILLAILIVFMKLGEATKFEYKGDQAKTKKERLVIKIVKKG